MWNHRKRRLATSRDPPRHGGQIAMYCLAMACQHCRMHFIGVFTENVEHK